MTIKRIIEKWKKVPIEQVLKELYIEKNMNIKQVADELGCSVGSIHSMLIEYKITKPQ